MADTATNPPMGDDDTTPVDPATAAKYRSAWFKADFKTAIQVPAHPDTKFDEGYFIQLLALSISLTLDEKKKIVEAVSKLSQYQVDELVRIFEEEQTKFAELAEKHPEQIDKLRAQHKGEWELFELEQQQANKSQSDNQQAEEIRKKLGLN